MTAAPDGLSDNRRKLVKSSKSISGFRRSEPIRSRMISFRFLVISVIDLSAEPYFLVRGTKLSNNDRAALISPRDCNIAASTQ